MPIDLSASYYDQYQRALRRAKESLAAGNGSDAAKWYRYAANYLAKYSDYVSEGRIRASLQARGARLRRLSERAQAGGLGGEPMSDAESMAMPDDRDALREAVSALVQRSKVTWDNIAGLDETKREIKTAYALTMARPPEGVTLTAPRTMLLYGPPGTGKTLLAAATSNGLDATFFGVKVSDMLSKYFGESTKLVDTLYDVARDRAPSVIFLDEFDALSRTRGEGGDSGAERRLLSTLLAELDGLNTKDDATFVLTIAATNRPWDIDSAVRSRFVREIYVPLPDETARQRILEIHLQGRGHETRMSYDRLVRRTADYSGREISQLCEQAVAHMVERMNPGLEEVVDRGRQAVAGYQIKTEALRVEDFNAAFQAVGPPQTKSEDLARFDTWLKEGD